MVLVIKQKNHYKMKKKIEVPKKTKYKNPIPRDQFKKKLFFLVLSTSSPADKISDFDDELKTRKRQIR